MKKIVNKVRIIIASFVLLMLGFSNVHAQAYYTRTRYLTPSTNLIVSLSAQESSGVYINGRNPYLYLDGVYGLKLNNINVELTKYGRGYKVAYRAQAEGKISYQFKAEFENAGFSIGGSTSGNINVYKYIQGVEYFEPSMPNQDCDRWGNCVWSIDPIGELQ